MTESAKPACKFCWIVRYLVVVAALLMGAFAYRTMNPPTLDVATLNEQLQGSTALPVGFRRVPNVALLGYDGKHQPAASFFEGQWTLAFFGYTYCPDICPAALANMAQTMAIVREKHPEFADTQILFVSVDPQRDTPERLKEYVEYFDPAFVGTTGDKVDIDELTQKLGALYTMVGETEGRDDYLVDHSSQIVLINPQGEMRAIITPPHLPNQMASDIALLRASL
ncbi:MAG: SCO family protein [Granulosicoccaceae bacterium]